MPYPIMAPNSTWFTPNVTTVTRSIITEIEIMDSYTPDESTTIVDSWDASAIKDGSITCYVIGTKLIIAGNGSGKIALNESAKYTFCDGVNWTDTFNNVTSIVGLSLFDLSSTKDITGFFYYMTNLESVNGIELWDTSSIENMGIVFCYCSSIASIDVSNWNVSNVQEIYSMFDRCKALTSLDLSKWNFNNPISFRQMFCQCENLISIGDLSNWTVTCTHMESMFQHCLKLENITLGNFILQPLNNNAFKFVLEKCTNLKSFSVKSFTTTANISCTALFQNCTKLNYIDLAEFDFSKVTDMSFMFYGCSSLKEIDVTNWDVSNCTNFDHFAAHANLKRKGIENWNTKSAVNMNAMFHNCAEEELDLSGFDTSNVKYFCQMFENSQNLKRIKGLDKWDTSSGVGFDEMFGRCYKLEEVDLSSFDTSKAKNGEAASTNGHKTATLMNMFTQCNSLRKVTLGSKFSINGNGSNTNAANKLILPTPSSDYIEGADGNWYDCLDNTYAANNIPDKTANIYFAVLSEAFDSDTTPVIVTRGALTKIAHFIRAKTGKTDKIPFRSFAQEIELFEGDTILISDSDQVSVEDGALVVEAYTHDETV